jgi:hypothetical protein
LLAIRAWTAFEESLARDDYRVAEKLADPSDWPKNHRKHKLRPLLEALRNAGG